MIRSGDVILKDCFFERQLTTHMLQRVILSVLVLTICLNSIMSQVVNDMAPDFVELDYSNKKIYHIAEVNVTGAERRDDNAIKSITGLREGQTIEIPSEALSNAVKGLWKLRLFSDVEILLDKIKSDSVYITIQLKEQPTLSGYEFKNVKKLQQDNLIDELGETFRIGGIISGNDRTVGGNKLRQYFVDKGFLDAQVKLSSIPDTALQNTIKLLIDVEKNDKVKISQVNFDGNVAISDKKLRKQLKDTKKKGTFLKRSRFVKEKYEDDKKKLIAYYIKNGYGDAQILRDSMWRDDKGLVNLTLFISEGVQYKFGKIAWKGNSIYTDDQLSAVLGIPKGSVFNPEELSKRLEFSLDGRDISSLYMDKGYLFFNVDPQPVAIRQDTIDIEMRMYEGPQATIDKVIIKGNDRTHEDVIRRVVRTRPGEKFSRSDIIRSQREISNLGYFDPENLNINTPVNYERGTVDIEYTVVERPSDQLELSAGYGGFEGLIGTLGVTFNNFSIQNIRNKAAWSPLPTGDAQRLSLRIQSNSRFFRSYNFSFTEPWLGGKKPNAFTVGWASSVFDNSAFGAGQLSINRLFAGLGTALKFPDDFFTSSTTVNFENIKLTDYANRFLVSNGDFKNFNIQQTFSRSSIANPMFPMGGSRVSLTIQFTPPYSLFRGDDFWVLEGEEREQAIQNEIRTLGVRGLASFDEDAFISEIEEARRFKFLEYHKWRFDAEWYYNITGKLVFMTQAKMGYLGSYNSNIGDVPFERFQLGGDGLSNQNAGIQGTDIIALRGYEIEDVSADNRTTGGGIIFNKFTTELRYPLSTNPNSTIFTTLYFQAGNQWNSFDDYNPFELRRTVGVGMRVFLPMFGLLGFDYGFGLDKTINNNPNPGLGALGKFSIVLGFEPD